MRPPCMDRTLFLFLPFVMVFLVSLATATVPNITTDQSALFALKGSISYDPHNILTSNWSINTSVCNWIGITCGSKHHRVTALNLSYMGLAGTIPPLMGNLSFLVKLSVTNNSFHGSIPNELARLYRLKLLDFGFNDINGEIPSWMGSLSKLQYLFLHGNGFNGTIPPSLSNISSLEIIDLGYNQLSGFVSSSLFNISTLQGIYLKENMLSGPLPSIIFNMPSLQVMDLKFNMFSGGLSMDMFDHLPNLQWLRLSYNKFYGKLPSALFKCKQLQALFLGVNNFTGRVSPEIGNLTMLVNFSLSNNNFQGEIPSEIGNLQDLELFNIENNNFTGPIPFEIFNISTLQVIAITLNNLSGHLPSNIDLFLPNLRELFLGGNKLSGTVPSSISNVSQLTDVELVQNSFSGLIPKSLGNLRLLERLNIGENNLTVGSLELSFLISSLSNCIYLKALILSDNPLNDNMPSSVGNLSTSLRRFSMFNCNIKGSIPSDIGNLSSLIALNLRTNELAGPIPTTVGRLHMLEGLFLQSNRLEGPIPSDLCRLESLVELNLTGNELSGHIPTCMDNLTSLRHLDLGFNRLTSIVHMSLWSLTYLLEVNLASNSLSGFLTSMNIENMKVLIKLDFSRNQLSGGIPRTINGLKDIVHLSFANNRLEGSIPESFGELVSLEFLDLSSNNLTGEIPKSLEVLQYLKYLNVSFNILQGEIPSGGPFVNFSAASFMSNKALCGAPRLQVPPCKEGAPRPKKATTMRALKYVLLAIGVTILVVAFLLAWIRCQKRNVKFPVEEESLLATTWRRISHQELLQATKGFNSNNLVGEGSFGSVYKGTLSDGMNVAIKVLNLKVEGAFKSFDAECEVLCNIRHRNLIKIISVCSCVDFKALILEYIPNGNLDKWLYSHNHYLSILQRLNIMIDVAWALEYLHYGYLTPIVHCDLKPNNILLDEDMVAHVTDFGTAKLLGDGNLMKRTMTLATIGYMAPVGWRSEVGGEVGDGAEGDPKNIGHSRIGSNMLLENGFYTFKKRNEETCLTILGNAPYQFPYSREAHGS
ncbi:probable LRR receptor-like serine/threonine-protein kinase At3g47570 [Corylus avellana]|uniref:probable LRR receptor-like serine/threonine-protein kinase At3g47570 n=1 Tax=Corylus avellana TaxID=13451 RepID=UPI00286C8C25|nr:probable LRR receptor-like serine/threonine-protein kinase At3g47570 [Corylus avellana]